jgi:uncharacterized protein
MLMPGDPDSSYRRLLDCFKTLDSVVVAFSGGVDSSVLAKASFDVLGGKALAVTLISPASDPGEIESAKEVARHIGVKHVLVEYNELDNNDFKSNTPDRCYYCKRELAKKLLQIAGEHGFKSIVEGTNAEDLQGHRPGARALRELGIQTPLADQGFSKSDVRALASRLGLPNAGKPSTACLASRIPYGVVITEVLLSRVSAAESVLRSLGVGQVRVRCFGDVAVIEVMPDDFDIVFNNRQEVSDRLLEAGFKRVTLDLIGYRSGSMSHS